MPPVILPAIPPAMPAVMLHAMLSNTAGNVLCGLLKSVIGRMKLLVTPV